MWQFTPGWNKMQWSATEVNCVHPFSAPTWWPKLSNGEVIYIMEISKCYNVRAVSPFREPGT